MQYEFECRECHRNFTVEETYRQHQRRQKKCPHCGSRKVEPLISPVHIKTSKKS
ncbi:MAG: zinc ribbon domain-containing protein [Planctomycetota bacterium]|nr:MAG: zinc ribbon domain-containing protein [Planctomycetota bacterium]